MTQKIYKPSKFKNPTKEIQLDNKGRKIEH